MRCAGYGEMEGKCEGETETDGRRLSRKGYDRSLCGVCNTTKRRDVKIRSRVNLRNSEKQDSQN